MKDPEIAATLADIDKARQRLGAALLQVKRTTMTHPLDWRGWVARHPVESILGAAAAGFVLAQPGCATREGEPGTLLGDLSRSGMEAALPLLFRSIL